MEMNVDDPNLNRGLAAGVRQDSFANFRDNDMSFPKKIVRGQPPPVPITNWRHTYNYPILPAQHQWDNLWGEGTVYFMKKDNNLLKQMFCLSSAKTMMSQNAILMHQERLAGPTDPDQATDAAREFKTGGPRDYTFMARMETIADKLAFAGVGIGPVDPGMQIGTLDMGRNTKYSGKSKQVPVVTEGHCFMPKLWDVKLRAGNNLYMILKPRKPGRKYYNPLGEALNTPPEIKEWHTIPDFSFYASDEAPPQYCTDYSPLLENLGGQPPTNDRAYIDWDYDANGIINGELKQGMCWLIGRVYNLEGAKTTTSSRFATVVQEVLPYSQDYNTYNKMAVQLDVQQIF